MQWPTGASAMRLHLVKQQGLRYGEKSSQTAAFYRLPEFATEHSLLVNAEQLNGANFPTTIFFDTDACWSLVREFDEPAVLFFEASESLRFCEVANDVATAYDKAFACDPKSALAASSLQQCNC